MGVWQGVAINSLKFHQGPPCPTLLHPAGGPPLKWPCNRFRGGLRQSSTLLDTPGRVALAFDPFRIPHEIRPCFWGLALSVPVLFSAGKRMAANRAEQQWLIWSDNESFSDLRKVASTCVLFYFLVSRFETQEILKFKKKMFQMEWKILNWLLLRSYVGGSHD
jgi:hypothetical protein